MGYIIYYQNDRNKKINQVSINLCGLLLLVILSLGFVICLLPATNNEDEEMAGEFVKKQQCKKATRV